MDVLILYIMAVMLIDPAGIMPFQCPKSVTFMAGGRGAIVPH